MRTFGPRARFDPHTSFRAPQDDPAGRAVVYVAEQLRTALQEVLTRETPITEVCPNWRAVVLRPASESTVLQDLVVASPLRLGAPADLGDGPPELYPETQRWARAIYEDRPADARVAGIRYWSRLDRGSGGGQSGVNRTVWDTAPPLQVLARGSRGAPVQQEFSLHTPDLWRTVVTTLDSVDLAARRISVATCDRCQRHLTP